MDSQLALGCQCCASGPLIQPISIPPRQANIVACDWAEDGFPHRLTYPVTLVACRPSRHRHLPCLGLKLAISFLRLANNVPRLFMAASWGISGIEIAGFDNALEMVTSYFGWHWYSLRPNKQCRVRRRWNIIMTCHLASHDCYRRQLAHGPYGGRLHILHIHYSLGFPCWSTAVDPDLAWLVGIKSLFVQVA